VDPNPPPGSETVIFVGLPPLATADLYDLDVDQVVQAIRFEMRAAQSRTAA
jgi:hypothetical protein